MALIFLRERACPCCAYTVVPVEELPKGRLEMPGCSSRVCMIFWLLDLPAGGENHGCSPRTCALTTDYRWDVNGLHG